MLLIMRFRRRSWLVLLLALACWLPAQHAFADKQSDLFRSAQMDDVRTVKALLGAGLDPNLADAARGETAMMVALRENSMRVFELLLAHPRTNIEAVSANGSTALMLAAFKHNKAALLALLAKGAYVNRPGWTALHFAAASGDDAIVRILLEQHAYIDTESPSKITPVMIAAREGHLSTVQVLLEEGADATLKNAEGVTAAEFAVKADKQFIADAIAQHLAAKARPKP
jgi:uncharacterized protein